MYEKSPSVSIELLVTHYPPASSYINIRFKRMLLNNQTFIKVKNKIILSNYDDLVSYSFKKYLNP